MSDVTIQVDSLSKRFQIGELVSAKHMRRKVARALGGGDNGNGDPDGNGEDASTLWALKDISFEVKRGEVLGILGSNGSGKSTLLKILSRITAPTEGRAVIKGRVGSLLEVGTGFHPELTGRENVYLNGSVLGMRRTEIARKFDEIVAFSGIERFIDTPVKRYSSGMRVRLGFAVAAHLDPEVLIVDEVLAVGDAQFQSKCINKMDQVVRDGRTVLFVSHNMATIESLCTRAIMLKNGVLSNAGDTEIVINDYIESMMNVEGSNLAQRTDRFGSRRVHFTQLELRDEFGQTLLLPRSGKRVQLAARYVCESPPVEVSLNLNVFTLNRHLLFKCNNQVANGQMTLTEREGWIVCDIPKLPLPPGEYSVNLKCLADGDLSDQVRDAFRIVVEAGDFYGTGYMQADRRGGVLVEQDWRLQAS